MKIAATLSILNALVLIHALDGTNPAEAQSARHCATERALGRLPPGCPRRQTPTLNRPDRPAPPRPSPPRRPRQSSLTPEHLLALCGTQLVALNESYASEYEYSAVVLRGRDDEHGARAALALAELTRATGLRSEIVEIILNSTVERFRGRLGPYNPEAEIAAGRQILESRSTDHDAISQRERAPFHICAAEARRREVRGEPAGE